MDDGRNGAAIVEAGAGNFVDPRRHLRALGQRLPHPRPGRQANTSLDSEGYSLGGSYVFKDGFVGVAYSSFDSTYFIPGIEAAEHKNHIVLNQTQMDQQGRVARQRLRPRGHPLLVRRHRLQARRGGFAAGHGHRLDLPPDKQYEARMEAQHLPVRTPLGVLRGAVGMQWSDRDL